MEKLCTKLNFCFFSLFKGLYFELVESQIAGKDEEADIVEDLPQTSAKSVKRHLSRKMSRQVSSAASAGQPQFEEEEVELKTNRAKLFNRLMQLTKPELIYVIIGCIAALVFGAATPFFAILFGDMMSCFTLPPKVSEGTKFLIFCLFGLTPTWRKESRYPVIRDFASCPGFALIVKPPSRSILGIEQTFLPPTKPVQS